MLIDGFIYMLVGMFFVFMFLSIMVFLMKVMSYFLLKVEEKYPEDGDNVSNITSSDSGKQEVAVAIAAVKGYVG